MIGGRALSASEINTTGLFQLIFYSPVMLIVQDADTETSVILLQKYLFLENIIQLKKKREVDWDLYFPVKHHTANT